MSDYAIMKALEKRMAERIETVKSEMARGAISFDKYNQMVGQHHAYQQVLGDLADIRATFRQQEEDDE